MAIPHRCLEAVIRTYEHQLVKVTVFASGRTSCAPPSYMSSTPSTQHSSLPQCTPPHSPIRMNRPFSPAKSRPPPMAAIASSSDSDTDSELSRSLHDNVDADAWRTICNLKRRRRYSFTNQASADNDLGCVEGEDEMAGQDENLENSSVNESYFRSKKRHI